MKRQSKAEEALTKQLREIRDRIVKEVDIWDNQKIRIETLTEIRMELEQEIDRLRAARVKASEKAKQ